MNFLLLVLTFTVLLFIFSETNGHNQNQTHSQSSPISKSNSKSSPASNKTVVSSPLKWGTLDGQVPLIFGHRGEKVLAPEHTLYGYELASILGADFVEPDLCLTKDNRFVCHHDLHLDEESTDVGDHQELQHLKKRMPDGTFKWPIKDLTLAEIKMLRLKQKNIGIRPQALNGIFQIPTFQEFLELIHKFTLKLNRTIGIIPELKEPKYHNEDHTPHFMENLLLTTLESNGYAVNANQKEKCEANIGGAANFSQKIKCPKVIIQSFELPSLEYIKQKSTFDLNMLVFNDPQLLTRQGIKKVAQTAKYYSVYKSILTVEAPLFLKFTNVTYNPGDMIKMGGFIPPKEITSVVHSNGLKLVAYTIYDSREPALLGCSMFFVTGKCPPMNKRQELQYFFDLGVDGLFVENVAESLSIRKDADYEIKTQQRILQRLKHEGIEPCQSSGSGTTMIYELYFLTVAFLLSAFWVQNS